MHAYAIHKSEIMINDMASKNVILIAGSVVEGDSRGATGTTRNLMRVATDLIFKDMRNFVVQHLSNCYVSKLAALSALSDFSNFHHVKFWETLLGMRSPQQQTTTFCSILMLAINLILSSY